MHVGTHVRAHWEKVKFPENFLVHDIRICCVLICQLQYNRASFPILYISCSQEISLFLYAQPGYVFGRVSLSVYMWLKNNDLFSALPLVKTLLSVLYLLVKFKCLQSGFLHPASCTDGAICACSIKAGPGILYYGIPRLVVRRVHCSAVCFLLLHIQQSSDSAICAHRVYAFCGTLVILHKKIS